MRKNRQRGSTLLEMALVLIPTLAMMFGILDFCLAIFLRSTFQHACREGVRYAVTYRTKAGMGQDASIKSVVQENAMGFLSGDGGLNKIKVQYYLPTTFERTTANAPGNIVEISIEDFQWGWIMPLLRVKTPLHLTARATDVMEALPGGTVAPTR